MKPQMHEHQIEELRIFISSFAAPQAKDRLLALLETKHGRATIAAGLDHVGWLDPRFATRVSSDAQTISGIERMLADRGAPDICRVMSTDPALNDKKMSLKEALAKVVAGGAGTIVFCKPGVLAYYESEEPQERYICAKPSPRAERK